ncbi:MAG: chemotaxis protein CheX [Magnetococcus sp. WYHC-3]
MQERLIRAMNEAVAEVFATCLLCEVHPADTVGNDPPVHPVQDDLDMVSLVSYGGALDGELHLLASREVVLDLAGRLVGARLTRLDEEATDAFGELANLVAGGVQARLEADLGSITLSTPTVLQGAGLRARTLVEPSQVVRRFVCDDGVLQVICFFRPRDSAVY